MSIDKSLGQAPLGMNEDMMGDEPALEIEIEDPEKVTIGMGGLEIILDPDEMPEDEFNANLAETDRKSTRLNSSHIQKSRMPSSA